MFKKLAAAAPFVAIALSSPMAMAADDARSSINISATIPTKQFHAQPRDPEFGKAEVMNYNPVSGELSNLRTSQRSAVTLATQWRSMTSRRSSTSM